MATRVPGTPEWERENLGISYPFVASASEAGQALGVRGKVVDFTMSVRDYSHSDVYSLTVSRTGGVTAITVLKNGVPVVTETTVPVTDVVGEFAVTYFSKVDSEASFSLSYGADAFPYQGCVITTAEDFEAGTAVLLPGRIFPSSTGVSSLIPAAGEDKVVGDVLVVAGRNLSASVNGLEVTLTGAADRSSCSVLAPEAEYLQTINGVGPDERGNIQIAGGSGGCIAVLPYPPANQVLLRGDCSSPSPRKGRAASYEKLLHVAAIYHLIAKALEGVDSSTSATIENMNTFIAERVEP